MLLTYHPNDPEVARNVLPPLIEMLEKGEASAAAKLLADLGPAAADAIPALEQARKKYPHDDSVLYLTSKALEKIRSRGVPEQP